MLIGVFAIPFLLIILLSKAELRVKKDEVTGISFSLLRFKLQFKQRKNKSEKRANGRGKKTSYKQLIPLLLKRIQSCEITIYKLAFPTKSDEPYFDGFLSQYKKTAFTFALLSYLESKARTLILSDEVISFSSDHSHFCFDFSVRFRLFHALLFCLDYLKASHKSRSKVRRRLCRTTK